MVGLYYAAQQALIKPYLVLLLATTGAFLGNIIHIIDGGAIPLSLFQLFYLSGLGLFVINWIYNGFQPIRKSGFELELALFYALIYLSIIWTPNTQLAFFHATRLVVLAGLLYLAVNWVKEPRQITHIFLSLAVIGTIMGLLSIYNTLNDPEAIVRSVLTDGARLDSRQSVGQVDPNIFASLFFIPIAFTAAYSFSKANLKIRAIAAFLFLVMITAVVVSFSRSAWVASIVLLLVLAIMYRQYNLFIVGAVAVLIASALIPEVRLLLTTITGRFMNLFTGELDTSNSIRVLLAQASVYMFFDSYLIGVGWRGFPEHIFNYFTAQQTHGVYEPHNVLYQIFAELGIIGFSLFGYVIYKIIRTAVRNIKLSQTIEEIALSRAMLAAFLAYGVFYQFIGFGFMDNMLWILTGLILALNYYLNSEKTKLLKASP